jgi:Tfp pilus assembly protein PilE
MTDTELACFESQDPNIEKFTKVLLVVHDAAACYKLIYEGNKRAAVKTSLAKLLKRIERKHEYQRELMSTPAAHKESSAECKGTMASKTAKVLKPFPIPQSHNLIVCGKVYCTVL